MPTGIPYNYGVPVLILTKKLISDLTMEKLGETNMSMLNKVTTNILCPEQEAEYSGSSKINKRKFSKPILEKLGHLNRMTQTAPGEESF